MRSVVALFFLSFFVQASESFVAQKFAGAEKEIDALVYQAMANNEVPGAVVLVSHHNEIAYRKAIGYKFLTPEKIPLTTDTLFDLASLTKVMVTAPLIMLLVERGKLDLKKPVAFYIPEFGINGKTSITVEQLLTHSAGLIPDNPCSDYIEGKEKALERIYALEPITSAGTFAYGDVDYIVLGELIERVTGERLDVFAQKNIFGPLEMRDTSFVPDESCFERIAPTESSLPRGRVHDPRARLLGGVAGHAGLFSTIDDVGKFCSMIMQKGMYNGVRILKAETIDAMEQKHVLDNHQIRGLGWDIKTDRSPYYQGTHFKEAFGHTGFSGTSLLFDRSSEVFLCILTSRLYPDGLGDAKLLRRAIADAVGKVVQKK